MKFVWDYI
uniref:Uncharacterized protein n=1 Tax=Rhizophora mucronata TaxID=61149 RepID=A0A2P2PXS1_RHIMU